MAGEDTAMKLPQFLRHASDDGSIAGFQFSKEEIGPMASEADKIASELDRDRLTREAVGVRARGQVLRQFETEGRLTAGQLELLGQTYGQSFGRYEP